jgi:four helix bundle protein
MHRFKELQVWEGAIDLAVDIYSITKKLPSEERFGLVSQLNRSAVSIPSNIAEGAGRNTNGEFRHFLGVAMGSSFELETQLIIASRIGYLSIDNLNETVQKINSIQNMNARLQKTLSV